jgi:hypothetical protein
LPALLVVLTANDGDGEAKRPTHLQLHFLSPGIRVIRGQNNSAQF